MNPEYQAWIDAYLTRIGDPRGKCKDACKEMLAAFPELRQVPGHVHSSSGKWGHTWLETESGEILDPTASQYEGISRYEPWKPGEEICVGRCLVCGVDLWRPVERLDDDNAFYGPCSTACFLKLKEEIEEKGEEAVLEAALQVLGDMATR